MRLALLALLLAGCGTPGEAVSPGVEMLRLPVSEHREGVVCNTFLEWSWCGPDGHRMRCGCALDDPLPLGECRATWREHFDQPCRR